MIKVETKKGETHLNINGNLSELEADFVIITRAIFKAIEEKNNECAKEFLRFIDEDLVDGVKSDFPEKLIALLDGKDIDSILDKIAKVIAEELTGNEN